jgi:hypothetical protein
MFADEVRAVAGMTQDRRGGDSRLRLGERVPGGGQRVAAGEEAGEQGQDEGLDGTVQGGAMQARAGSAGARRTTEGRTWGGTCGLGLPWPEGMG